MCNVCVCVRTCVGVVCVCACAHVCVVCKCECVYVQVHVCAIKSLNRMYVAMQGSVSYNFYTRIGLRL